MSKKWSKRVIGAILAVVLVVGGKGLRVGAVDPVEDLQNQINELAHLRRLSEEATRPLEQELANLNKKIKGIEASLIAAEKEMVRLGQSIDEREAELGVSYKLLAVRVRNYYKLSRYFSPLVVFLSSKSASEFTLQMAYWERVADQDKAVIMGIATEIGQLEKDKQKLASDKIKLASLRKEFEGQAAFFQKEVAGAKAYQAELSGQIAALTAKQQEILAEKTGTFQTTVGDVPLADDPNSRPDYNPGFSPAYAAFSFGAPHFKGMSQYGAFGRARGGQKYDEILRAYYGGGIEIRDHDVNAQIVVDGYGSFSLEEYAKRIYEVPNSWGDEGGMEALKAQAVAARSYALARGGSICATEACQVFKPSPKGGNWDRAVEETRGKVIYANGAPFSTWYASTSGGYQESYSSNGYSTPGFWDTPSGRSGWTAQAWEKQAGSPWFYKGWYRSRSGDTCGRSHPWLTSEEMADILNAWVVLYGGGGDSSRVTPIGSCWGGNPYSMDELRSIGGFSSISGVSVTYSDGGVTSAVTWQTNKGSVSVKGSEFYKAFNLRAPGRIALKSGLFNIEKK